MTVLARCVLLMTLGASTFACSKPKPPELTPTEATVSGVDVAGFDLRLKMDAFNPNKFDIHARNVVAHVVLNGTEDLGTITTPTALALPAGGHTPLNVSLRAPWKGLTALATLAQANKPVPYTLEGTVTVGGESLNVDVPFKMDGKLTPEQLREATARSLRGLLPGLSPP